MKQSSILVTEARHDIGTYEAKTINDEAGSLSPGSFDKEGRVEARSYLLYAWILHGDRRGSTVQIFRTFGLQRKRPQGLQVFTRPSPWPVMRSGAPQSAPVGSRTRARPYAWSYQAVSPRSAARGPRSMSSCSSCSS